MLRTASEILHPGRDARTIVPWTMPIEILEEMDTMDAPDWDSGAVSFDPYV